MSIMSRGCGDESGTSCTGGVTRHTGTEGESEIKRRSNKRDRLRYCSRTGDSKQARMRITCVVDRNSDVYERCRKIVQTHAMKRTQNITLKAGPNQSVVLT